MREKIKQLFSQKNTHWFLIVAFGLVWLGVTLYKYYQFGYNAVDLGIINQAVWNTWHGHWAVSSIHPPSYLGDHFNPIIGLFLLVYWLWPEPPTLIIIQILFLALSAWPIYRLAKRLLPEKYKSYSWVASFLWLANPIISNLVFYEFHFMSLALFFSFWSLDFYFADRQEKDLIKKSKYWKWFLIFTILLLFVREDMSFFVIMLGVVALIDKKNWRWSFLPIILGVIYFLLAGSVTSHFNLDGHYKYLVHYQWMGGTVKDILLFVFQHPLKFILHFFLPENLELNFAILLIFFLLPVFGKYRYLLLLLPFWLQIALTNKGGNLLYLETHYTAMWLPALVVCSLFGFVYLYDHGHLSKVEKWLDLSWGKISLIFGLPIIVILFFTIGPPTGKPISFYLSDDLNWLNKTFSSIPKDNHLAVTSDLLANISSRPNIYNLHYHIKGTFQYSSREYVLPNEVTDIVINTRDFYKSESNQIDEQRLRNLLEERNFGLVSFENGLQYWRKDYADEFIPMEFINVQPTDLKDIFNGRSFLDIDYLGNSTPQLNNGLWEIRTFWSAKQELSPDQKIQVSWLDKEYNTIHKEIYSLGWALYSTSEWKSGQVIRINFWLSSFDDLTGFNFKLFPGDSLHFLINKWGGGNYILSNDQSDREIDVELPKFSR